MSSPFLVRHVNMIDGNKSYVQSYFLLKKSSLLSNESFSRKAPCQISVKYGCVYKIKHKYDDTIERFKGTLDH